MNIFGKERQVLEGFIAYINKNRELFGIEVFRPGQRTQPLVVPFNFDGGRQEVNLWINKGLASSRIALKGVSLSALLSFVREVFRENKDIAHGEDSNVWEELTVIKNIAQLDEAVTLEDAAIKLKANILNKDLAEFMILYSYEPNFKHELQLVVLKCEKQIEKFIKTGSNPRDKFGDIDYEVTPIRIYQGRERKIDLHIHAPKLWIGLLPAKADFEYVMRNQRRGEEKGDYFVLQEGLLFKYCITGYSDLYVLTIDGKETVTCPRTWDYKKARWEAALYLSERISGINSFVFSAPNGWTTIFDRNINLEEVLNRSQELNIRDGGKAGRDAIIPLSQINMAIKKYLLPSGEVQCELTGEANNRVVASLHFIINKDHTLIEELLIKKDYLVERGFGKYALMFIFESIADTYPNIKDVLTIAHCYENDRLEQIVKLFALKLDFDSAIVSGLILDWGEIGYTVRFKKGLSNGLRGYLEELRQRKDTIIPNYFVSGAVGLLRQKGDPAGIQELIDYRLSIGALVQKNTICSFYPELAGKENETIANLNWRAGLLNGGSAKVFDGGVNENLSLYEEIYLELKNGEEKLRISKQEIESSPGILEFFTKIKINKFVELARIHSAAELNLVLNSIIEDKGITDKDLLVKGISLWPRVFWDSESVNWGLDGNLKSRLKPEISEEAVKEALKKIARGLDNKVYIYKKYSPGIIYFIYDRKQKIGLTVSIRESTVQANITEINILELQTVQTKVSEKTGKELSPGDIERSVLFGTIVQIKTEGRGAYKSAMPIIWRHYMPGTLSQEGWRAYLNSLKLSQYLINIYLKIAQYISANKNYLGDYSFERFFLKSLVLLHHSNEEIEKAVFVSLREIEEALRRSKGWGDLITDNKLREIAGEISGIYEVSVKRGTTLGYFSRNPIRVTRLIIKGIKEAVFQEWDALNKDSAFEFKHTALLSDLYYQILGIGKENCYLRSLLCGRYAFAGSDENPLENIHNIVFLGENSHPAKHLRNALLHFIENYRGKEPPVIIENGKSISLKFTIDSFMDFLMDKTTIGLAKKELSWINNGNHLKQSLREELEKLEVTEKGFAHCLKMMDKLEKRANRDNRKFHIILGISNFSARLDGGQAKDKLVAEFVKIEPKVFFTRRQLEVMLGTLRGRAIGEMKSETLKVPRQLGLVDEKFDTTPKFTEFIMRLKEGKITTDYLWEKGLSRWLDDENVMLEQTAFVKSQAEYYKLLKNFQDRCEELKSLISQQKLNFCSVFILDRLGKNNPDIAKYTQTTKGNVKFHLRHLKKLIDTDRDKLWEILTSVNPISRKILKETCVPVKNSHLKKPKKAADAQKPRKTGSSIKTSEVPKIEKEAAVSLKELEILRKIPEEGIPAKERTKSGLIARLGSYGNFKLLMALKTAKETRDFFDDEPGCPLKLSLKGRSLLENKKDGGMAEAKINQDAIEEVFRNKLIKMELRDLIEHNFVIARKGEGKNINYNLNTNKEIEDIEGTLFELAGINEKARQVKCGYSRGEALGILKKNNFEVAPTYREAGVDRRAIAREFKQEIEEHKSKNTPTISQIKEEYIKAGHKNAPGARALHIGRERFTRIIKEELRKYPALGEDFKIEVVKLMKERKENIVASGVVFSLYDGGGKDKNVFTVGMAFDSLVIVVTAVFIKDYLYSHANLSLFIFTLGALAAKFIFKEWREMPLNDFRKGIQYEMTLPFKIWRIQKELHSLGISQEMIRKNFYAGDKWFYYLHPGYLFYLKERKAGIDNLKEITLKIIELRDKKIGEGYFIKDNHIREKLGELICEVLNGKVWMVRAFIDYEKAHYLFALKVLNHCLFKGIYPLDLKGFIEIMKNFGMEQKEIEKIYTDSQKKQDGGIVLVPNYNRYKRRPRAVQFQLKVFRSKGYSPREQTEQAMKDLRKWLGSVNNINRKYNSYTDTTERAIKNAEEWISGFNPAIKGDVKRKEDIKSIGEGAKRSAKLLVSLERIKGAGAQLRLRMGNPLANKNLYFIYMADNEKRTIIDDLFWIRNYNEFIFQRMLDKPIEHLQYKITIALNIILRADKLPVIEDINDIRVLHCVLELIKIKDIGFTQDAINEFIRSEYKDKDKIIKLNELLGAARKDGGHEQKTLFISGNVPQVTSDWELFMLYKFILPDGNSKVVELNIPWDAIKLAAGKIGIDAGKYTIRDLDISCDRYFLGAKVTVLNIRVIPLGKDIKMVAKYDENNHDPESILEREMVIMNLLSYSGVNSPEFLGKAKNKNNLFMEYKGEITLEARLRQKISDKKIREMGIKFAEEVFKMHEAGIIHGDIAADNVLLDKNGDPVIIDFGLSDIPKKIDFAARINEFVWFDATRWVEPCEILTEEAAYDLKYKKFSVVFMSYYIGCYLRKYGIECIAREINGLTVAEKEPISKTLLSLQPEIKHLENNQLFESLLWYLKGDSDGGNNQPSKNTVIQLPPDLELYLSNLFGSSLEWEVIEYIIKVWGYEKKGFQRKNLEDYLLQKNIMKIEVFRVSLRTIGRLGELGVIIPGARGYCKFDQAVWPLFLARFNEKFHKQQNDGGAASEIVKHNLSILEGEESLKKYALPGGFTAGNKNTGIAAVTINAEGRIVKRKILFEIEGGETKANVFFEIGDKVVHLCRDDDGMVITWGDIHFNLVEAVMRYNAEVIKRGEEFAWYLNLGIMGIKEGKYLIRKNWSLISKQMPELDFYSDIKEAVEEARKVYLRGGLEALEDRARIKDLFVDLIPEILCDLEDSIEEIGNIFIENVLKVVNEPQKTKSPSLDLTQQVIFAKIRFKAGDIIIENHGKVSIVTWAARERLNLKTQDGTEFYDAISLKKMVIKGINTGLVLHIYRMPKERMAGQKGWNGKDGGSLYKEIFRGGSQENEKYGCLSDAMKYRQIKQTLLKKAEILRQRGEFVDFVDAFGLIGRFHVFAFEALSYGIHPKELPLDKYKSFKQYTWQLCLEDIKKDYRFKQIIEDSDGMIGPERDTALILQIIKIKISKEKKSNTIPEFIRLLYAEIARERKVLRQELEISEPYLNHLSKFMARKITVFLPDEKSDRIDLVRKAVREVQDKIRTRINYPDIEVTKNNLIPDGGSAEKQFVEMLKKTSSVLKEGNYISAFVKNVPQGLSINLKTGKITKDSILQLRQDSKEGPNNYSHQDARRVFRYNTQMEELTRKINEVSKRITELRQDYKGREAEGDFNKLIELELNHISNVLSGLGFIEGEQEGEPTEDIKSKRDYIERIRRRISRGEKIDWEEFDRNMAGWNYWGKDGGIAAEVEEKAFFDADIIKISTIERPSYYLGLIVRFLSSDSNDVEKEYVIAELNKRIMFYPNEIFPKFQALENHWLSKDDIGRFKEKKEGKEFFENLRIRLNQENKGSDMVSVINGASVKAETVSRSIGKRGRLSASVLQDGGALDEDSQAEDYLEFCEAWRNACIYIAKGAGNFHTLYGQKLSIPGLHIRMMKGSANAYERLSQMKGKRIEQRSPYELEFVYQPRAREYSQEQPYEGKSKEQKDGGGAQLKKKLAIIIGPKADSLLSNKSTPIHKFLFATLEIHNYEIKFYEEVNTVTKLIECVKDATKEQTASLLVVIGHGDGDEQTINLGLTPEVIEGFKDKFIRETVETEVKNGSIPIAGNELVDEIKKQLGDLYAELEINLENLHRLKEIQNKFLYGCAIVFYSCEAGQGEDKEKNLVNSMRDIIPQARYIMGPPTSIAGLMHWIFKGEELEDIQYRLDIEKDIVYQQAVEGLIEISQFEQEKSSLTRQQIEDEMNYFNSRRLELKKMRAESPHKIKRFFYKVKGSAYQLTEENRRKGYGSIPKDGGSAAKQFVETLEEMSLILQKGDHESWEIGERIKKIIRVIEINQLMQGEIEDIKSYLNVFTKNIPQINEVVTKHGYSLVEDWEKFVTGAIMRLELSEDIKLSTQKYIHKEMDGSLIEKIAGELSKLLQLSEGEKKIFPWFRAWLYFYFTLEPRVYIEAPGGLLDKLLGRIPFKRKKIFVEYSEEDFPVALFFGTPGYILVGTSWEPHGGLYINLKTGEITSRDPSFQRRQDKKEDRDDIKPKTDGGKGAGSGTTRYPSVARDDSILQDGGAGESKTEAEKERVNREWNYLKIIDFAELEKNLGVAWDNARWVFGDQPVNMFIEYLRVSGRVRAGPSEFFSGVFLPDKGIFLDEEYLNKPVVELFIILLIRFGDYLRENGLLEEAGLLTAAPTPSIKQPSPEFLTIKISELKILLEGLGYPLVKINGLTDEFVELFKNIGFESFWQKAALIKDNTPELIGLLRDLMIALFENGYFNFRLGFLSSRFLVYFNVSIIGEKIEKADISQEEKEKLKRLLIFATQSRSTFLENVKPLRRDLISFLDEQDIFSTIEEAIKFWAKAVALYPWSPELLSQLPAEIRPKVEEQIKAIKAGSDGGAGDETEIKEVRLRERIEKIKEIIVDAAKRCHGRNFVVTIIFDTDIYTSFLKPGEKGAVGEVHLNIGKPRFLHPDLRTASDKEIAFIIAHEIAHWTQSRLLGIEVLLLYALIITIVALTMVGIFFGWSVTLSLALFVIGQLLWIPIYVSWWKEKRADKIGLFYMKLAGFDDLEVLLRIMSKADRLNFLKRTPAVKRVIAELRDKKGDAFIPSDGEAKDGGDFTPAGQFIAGSARFTNLFIVKSFLYAGYLAYRVNLEYLKKSGKITGPPGIRHIAALFYPLARRLDNGQFYFNIPKGEINKILSNKFKYPSEIISWFFLQIKFYESSATKKEAESFQEDCFNLIRLNCFNKDGGEKTRDCLIRFGVSPDSNIGVSLTDNEADVIVSFLNEIKDRFKPEAKGEKPWEYIKSFEQILREYNITLALADMHSLENFPLNNEVNDVDQTIIKFTESGIVDLDDLHGKLSKNYGSNRDWIKFLVQKNIRKEEVLQEYLKNYLKDARYLFKHHTLKRIEDRALYRQWVSLELDKKYLFDWNKVPSNGWNKFSEFLKQNFGLLGLETVKIEKSDDGMTLIVFAGKNLVTLEINCEKTSVNMRINDGRNYQLFVERRNGELNIYDRVFLKKDNNGCTKLSPEDKFFLKLLKEVLPKKDGGAVASSLEDNAIEAQLKNVMEGYDLLKELIYNRHKEPVNDQEKLNKFKFFFAERLEELNVDEAIAPPEVYATKDKILIDVTMGWTVIISDMQSEEVIASGGKPVPFNLCSGLIIKGCKDNNIVLALSHIPTGTVTAKYLLLKLEEMGVKDLQSVLFCQDYYLKDFRDLLGTRTNILESFSYSWGSENKVVATSKGVLIKSTFINRKQKEKIIVFPNCSPIGLENELKVNFLLLKQVYDEIPFSSLDKDKEEFKPLFETNVLLIELGEEIEKFVQNPNKQDFETIFLITKLIVSLGQLFKDYAQNTIYDIEKNIIGYENYKIEVSHLEKSREELLKKGGLRFLFGIPLMDKNLAIYKDRIDKTRKSLKVHREYLRRQHQVSQKDLDSGLGDSKHHVSGKNMFKAAAKYPEVSEEFELLGNAYTKIIKRAKKLGIISYRGPPEDFAVALHIKGNIWNIPERKVRSILSELDYSPEAIDFIIEQTYLHESYDSHDLAIQAQRVYFLESIFKRGSEHRDYLGTAQILVNIACGIEGHLSKQAYLALENILAQNEKYPRSLYRVINAFDQITYLKPEIITHTAVDYLKNILSAKEPDLSVQAAAGHTLSDIVWRCPAPVAKQAFLALETILSLKVFEPLMYAEISRNFNRISSMRPEVIIDNTVNVLKNILGTKGLDLTVYSVTINILGHIAINAPENIAKEAAIFLGDIFKNKELNSIIYTSAAYKLSDVVVKRPGVVILSKQDLIRNIFEIISLNDNWIAYIAMLNLLTSLGYDTQNLSCILDDDFPNSTRRIHQDFIRLVNKINNDYKDIITRITVLPCSFTKHTIMFGSDIDGLVIVYNSEASLEEVNRAELEFSAGLRNMGISNWAPNEWSVELWRDIGKPLVIFDKGKFDLSKIGEAGVWRVKAGLREKLFNTYKILSPAERDLLRKINGMSASGAILDFPINLYILESSVRVLKELNSKELIFLDEARMEIKSGWGIERSVNYEIAKDNNNVLSVFTSGNVAAKEQLDGGMGEKAEKMETFPIISDMLKKLLMNLAKSGKETGPPGKQLRNLIEEEQRDLEKSIQKLTEENQIKIQALLPIVEKITSFEPRMRQLSDKELQEKTNEFRARLDKGQTRDEILPEAFAVVREAFWRLKGIRLYDVQMIGGIVMYQGKVAEIKTGEGKTYVAMLPAYLHALSSQKVHIITQNDYLAKRDYQKTRKLYEFLGLSVGLIQDVGTAKRISKNNIADVLGSILLGVFLVGMSFMPLFMVFSIAFLFSESEIISGIFVIAMVLFAYLMIPELFSLISPFRTIKAIILKIEGPFRKEVYKKDIVFTTPSTGFDYLRGNLSYSQLAETFAILDEVDYSFIDLNGSALGFAYVVGRGKGKYLKQIAEELKLGSDYVIEKGNITLTSEGEVNVNRILTKKWRKEYGTKDAIEYGYSSKYTAVSLEILTNLEFIKAYLKVKISYRKGVHYLVEKGEIKVIDQSTGRKKPNSRYALGIHQLLELKENLNTKKDTRLVTLPLPIFFQFYRKKSGMSGTADFNFAKEELKRIYGISDVVVIPTRKPNIRDDLLPKIFLNATIQYQALVDKIEELYRAKRPVLAATASDSESERLSRMLKEKGIRHKVLNAKTEKYEAKIVKEAGKIGAVTVSTNIAGRGTDIILTKEAVKLGGLFVVSTTLSQISLRLDYQLKGRAARQGQPGETQDFIVLPQTIKERFNASLVLKEDGAIDLQKRPELLEVVKKNQEDSEKNGYHHRLIQFMIDYIFYQQERLGGKLHPGKWKDYCLWRESYLINTSDTHTEKGYEEFKKVSFERFEDILSKEYWVEDPFGNKEKVSRNKECIEEWPVRKKEIEDKEGQVLQEEILPAETVENSIPADISIKQLLFSVNSLLLILIWHIFLYHNQVMIL
ncbi:MAG: protein kinase [Candidatus Omnitrophica bacterium]|nr:protein kinase [Candidatus Omnitrophota bacterium]